MHEALHVLLRLALIGGFVPTVAGLICYSCTSALSPTIEESAQLAMRIFVDSAYRAPPVHALCNREHDVEFQTVPALQCSINDQCVKVESQSKDLGFIIRGCKSHIFRQNVEVSRVQPCSADSSPSICFCEENLCNSAAKFRANLMITAIFHLFTFKLLLFSD